MLSRIYKRMAKFISFIKDLITFFLDEMNKRLVEIDKRLIEINNKMKERNEYIEVLKDCGQLDCVECKFNKMCDFSNLKKVNVKGDKQ
jgi:hypothetical protein